MVGHEDRGIQGQKIEMDVMRHMIEDLSQAVQVYRDGN